MGTGTDYNRAMEYLKEAERFCGEISLTNIKVLMNRLENPQEGLNIVHIGGTNGKGSTAIYCAFALAMAGYRVGIYSSPALLNYWERIQILEKKENGQCKSHCISENSVAKYMILMKNTIESIIEGGGAHPTPFEIETAMAFLEFKHKGCDIVILEVGMGGRLDATNIIAHPRCSVLTSISMDHTHFLGDTLEQIAKEKAGIIKKKVPVVSYQQRPEVMETIQKVCEEKETFVKVADFNQIYEVSHTIQGISVSYKDYKNLKLSILGENQVKNAATAIEVLEVLEEEGYQIKREHIYKGFCNAKWLGRFSIVNQSPLVIVDGAHNADAAISLRKSIELYLKEKEIYMIIGIFADKDYHSILKETIPYAKRVYTVNAEGERSLSSTKLAKAVGYYTANVEDCKTVEMAWKRLNPKSLNENEIILCFGSLSFLYQVFHQCKRE